ncbi:unnamed protein product [Diatraea saccharalis]|uniref:Peptidase M14 domain-containing protein n=1 Tax=Diatraea saccharalis TaxID=40085 RepID=A0A9N9QV49_9NEOP|nr:unnamed protein product [Diatraea saccharalis]
MLLVPYSDSIEHGDNYDDLIQIGKTSLEYGERVNGEKYDGPGTAAELLYKASGGSMDWVRNKLGTPIAYTYELRGTYFHWPPNRIHEQGDEITQMLLGLFIEAEKLGGEIVNRIDDNEINTNVNRGEIANRIDNDTNVISGEIDNRINENDTNVNRGEIANAIDNDTNVISGKIDNRIDENEINTNVNCGEIANGTDNDTNIISGEIVNRIDDNEINTNVNRGEIANRIDNDTNVISGEIDNRIDENDTNVNRGEIANGIDNDTNIISGEIVNRIDENDRYKCLLCTAHASNRAASLPFFPKTGGVSRNCVAPDETLAIV